MCKEVGAYPKCTSPDFVAPDATPGVMTWPELLEHMDNLSEWGHGQIKSWSQGSAFLGVKEQGAQTEQACLAEDVAHRTQVQNKLAGVCVDMCKEVGAFPKCTCPDFVARLNTRRHDMARASRTHGQLVRVGSWRAEIFDRGRSLSGVDASCSHGKHPDVLCWQR